MAALDSLESFIPALLSTSSTSTSPSSLPLIPLNLDSLAGLRGIAALWVMFFHCFLNSKVRIDFQGSSLMPLFFMLTGFTLAITYNNIYPTPAEITANPSLINNHKVSIWRFYNNRLVRVLPVYYLMNFLFALPLWYYGYGDADPVNNSIAINASISTTATITSTLFIFLLGGALDGPAWTVQTFLCMWLCFPFSMRNTRNMTVEQLSDGITMLYWLQFVLVIVTFVPLLIILGFWPAFAAATMHPLTRYPLFLMGIYAGELCIRAKTKQIPLSPIWPKGYFFPSRRHDCSCCCRSNQLASVDMNREEVLFWNQRVVYQPNLLVLITLVVTFIDFGAGSSILGAVWLQAMVPFSQLELIVALTLETGSSITARVLRTRLARWLGTLSMTIYLVHYPSIFYLCWTINHGHPVSWPISADEKDWIRWADQRTIPMWGIPVVGALSITLACLVYYYFEEPVRRLLSKK